MSRYIEIHLKENGSGGKAEEQIRGALESDPQRVVVVWCEDESQADSISRKMSRKELELVQYAWRVRGAIAES